MFEHEIAEHDKQRRMHIISAHTAAALALPDDASEHYTEAAYHEGMATAFRAAAARFAPLVEAFEHVCRERDEAEEANR